MQTAKISARLDPKTAGNLRRLERKWLVSRTEAIARAVNTVADREAPKRRKFKNAYEALMSSGFVGGGTADVPSDLSSNYKKYLWGAGREADRHR